MGGAALHRVRYGLLAAVASKAAQTAEGGGASVAKIEEVSSASATGDEGTEEGTKDDGGAVKTESAVDGTALAKPPATGGISTGASNSKLDIPPYEPPNVMPRVTCCLCLRSGGPMRIGCERQWVHVACVLFLREGPHFQNVAGLSDPANLNKYIAAHRQQKYTCCLCGSGAGFTSRCMASGCRNRVHIPCAFEHNVPPSLELVSYYSATAGVEKVVKIVTCDVHGATPDSWMDIVRREHAVLERAEQSRQKSGASGVQAPGSPTEESAGHLANVAAKHGTQLHGMGGGIYSAAQGAEARGGASSGRFGGAGGGMTKAERRVRKSEGGGGAYEEPSNNHQPGRAGGGAGRRVGDTPMGGRRRGAAAWHRRRLGGSDSDGDAAVETEEEEAAGADGSQEDEDYVDDEEDEEEIAGHGLGSSVGRKTGEGATPSSGSRKLVRERSRDRRAGGTTSSSTRGRSGRSGGGVASTSGSGQAGHPCGMKGRMLDSSDEDLGTAAGMQLGSGVQSRGSKVVWSRFDSLFKKIWVSPDAIRALDTLLRTRVCGEMPEIHSEIFDRIKSCAVADGLTCPVLGPSEARQIAEVLFAFSDIPTEQDFRVSSEVLDFNVDGLLEGVLDADFGGTALVGTDVDASSSLFVKSQIDDCDDLPKSPKKIKLNPAAGIPLDSGIDTTGSNMSLTTTELSTAVPTSTGWGESSSGGSSDVTTPSREAQGAGESHDGSKAFPMSDEEDDLLRGGNPTTGDDLSSPGGVDTAGTDKELIHVAGGGEAVRGGEKAIDAAVEEMLLRAACEIALAPVGTAGAFPAAAGWWRRAAARRRRQPVEGGGRPGSAVGASDSGDGGAAVAGGDKVSDRDGGCLDEGGESEVRGDEGDVKSSGRDGGIEVQASAGSGDAADSGGSASSNSSRSGGYARLKRQREESEVTESAVEGGDSTSALADGGRRAKRNRWCGVSAGGDVSGESVGTDGVGALSSSETLAALATPMAEACQSEVVMIRKKLQKTESGGGGGQTTTSSNSSLLALVNLAAAKLTDVEHLIESLPREQRIQLGGWVWHTGPALPVVSLPQMADGILTLQTAERLAATSGGVAMGGGKEGGICVPKPLIFGAPLSPSRTSAESPSSLRVEEVVEGKGSGSSGMQEVKHEEAADRTVDDEDEDEDFVGSQVRLYGSLLSHAVTELNEWRAGVLRGMMDENMRLPAMADKGQFVAKLHKRYLGMAIWAKLRESIISGHVDQVAPLADIPAFMNEATLKAGDRQQATLGLPVPSTLPVVSSQGGKAVAEQLATSAGHTTKKRAAVDGEGDTAGGEASKVSGAAAGGTTGGTESAGGMHGRKSSAETGSAELRGAGVLIDDSAKVEHSMKLEGGSASAVKESTAAVQATGESGEAACGVEDPKAVAVGVEDNAIALHCQVCFGTETVDSFNCLMTCARCQCVVHRQCYAATTANGGELEPQPDWLCKRCQVDRKCLGASVSSQFVASFIPGSARCVVCGLAGGPLKKTVGPTVPDLMNCGADGAPPPSSSKWVHVTCALWLMDEAVSTDKASLDLWDLSRIAPWRYEVTCALCGRESVNSGGVESCCVRCCHEGCDVAYHVSCAWLHGLYVEVSQRANCPIALTSDQEIRGEPSDCTMPFLEVRHFCFRHTPTSAQPRSVSAQRELRMRRMINRDICPEAYNYSNTRKGFAGLVKESLTPRMRALLRHRLFNTTRNSMQQLRRSDDLTSDALCPQYGRRRQLNPGAADMQEASLLDDPCFDEQTDETAGAESTEEESAGPQSGTAESTGAASGRQPSSLYPDFYVDGYCAICLQGVYAETPGQFQALCVCKRCGLYVHADCYGVPPPDPEKELGVNATGLPAVSKLSLPAVSSDNAEKNGADSGGEASEVGCESSGIDKKTRAKVVALKPIPREFTCEVCIAGNDVDETPCLLCPRRGGAMKLVQPMGGDPEGTPSALGDSPDFPSLTVNASSRREALAPLQPPRKFVHMTCALFTPGITTTDNAIMSPVLGVWEVLKAQQRATEVVESHIESESRVVASRQNFGLQQIPSYGNVAAAMKLVAHPCCVCGRRRGVAQPCSHANCTRHVHPLCAQLKGCFMQQTARRAPVVTGNKSLGAAAGGKEGAADATEVFFEQTLYCPQHTALRARMAPSLHLYFTLRSYIEMTRQIASAIREREEIKQQLFQKEMQSLESRYPLASSLAMRYGTGMQRAPMRLSNNVNHLVGAAVPASPTGSWSGATFCDSNMSGGASGMGLPVLMDANDGCGMQQEQSRWWRWDCADSRGVWESLSTKSGQKRGEAGIMKGGNYGPSRKLKGLVLGRFDQQHGRRLNHNHQNAVQRMSLEEKRRRRMQLMHRAAGGPKNAAATGARRNTVMRATAAQQKRKKQLIHAANIRVLKDVEMTELAAIMCLEFSQRKKRGRPTGREKAVRHLAQNDWTTAERQAQTFGQTLQEVLLAVNGDLAQYNLGIVTSDDGDDSKMDEDGDTTSTRPMPDEAAWSGGLASEFAVQPPTPLSTTGTADGVGEGVEGGGAFVEGVRGQE